MHCAVFNCTNSYNKTSKSASNISYYRFPKSKKSSIVRKAWINTCKRSDPFDPDKSRICSIHFIESDFQRDLKNELLGLPVRKILKDSVVPTINLPEEIPSEKLKKAQCAYSQKVKLAKKELLQSIENVQAVKDLQKNNEENITNTRNPDSMGLLFNKQQQDIIIHENKFNQLLQEHTKVKEDLQNVKMTLKRTQKMLKYYKLKHKDHLLHCKKKVNEPNELDNFLTENQMKLLSKKKKRINWTPDEIAKAFSLRDLDVKNYSYLRNELKLPLPGLSTLRKWSSRRMPTKPEINNKNVDDDDNDDAEIITIYTDVDDV